MKIIILAGVRCEKPQHLMPSVILTRSQGDGVHVSDGLKCRDYLHVEHTARGIVDTYESNVDDIVTICSGETLNQLQHHVNGTVVVLSPAFTQTA